MINPKMYGDFREQEHTQEQVAKRTFITQRQRGAQ